MVIMTPSYPFRAMKGVHCAPGRRPAGSRSLLDAHVERGNQPASFLGLIQ